MATPEQTQILSRLGHEGLRAFEVTKRCAYRCTKPGDLIGIRPLHEFDGEGQYLMLCDGEPTLFWATTNMRGGVQARQYKFFDIELSVTLTKDEFADLVLGKVAVRYSVDVFGGDWLGEAA